MPIDRHALVTRHNITLTDPLAPLALGNGEFCFGVDGTGLQTFAGNCMSHWGWHSFPLPNGWTEDRVPATGTFQQGRCVGPDKFPPGTEDIRKWMYDNPHILNLGRLRLTRADGTPVGAGEVRDASRQLDLWSGTHTARFVLDNQRLVVTACVHPKLDLVAVRIEGPQGFAERWDVTLDFAYPSLENRAWVGDFDQADGHTTEAQARSAARIDLVRRVHATTYHAVLAGGHGCAVSAAGESGHAFAVRGGGGETLSFVCAFSATPLPDRLPTFDETAAACAEHWRGFWMGGGAVDLSGSKDARWRELERRVVLSQYQMAAQSAGSWCSSETGLLGIDMWRGQFHMEMVWWHLAHYALWGRWQMGSAAIDCYQRFAPAARQLAEQLGYRGLKWQKSVGPNARTAPWYGNQVLLWKQPHPIFFAELHYRLHPSRETLEKWAPIIEGTADHMADYAVRDDATGVYHLDPAMPPCERGITRDAVFDLAYWRWGLDAAQVWRERVGLSRVPHWDEVRRHLAPLPTLDGVYIHSPDWTDTYGARAWEHPDPVGVLGMLPPTEGVDLEVATRTVAKVWSAWDWNRCWGWDFPWIAMAAARTGQPQIAVDALLKDSPRNAYDVQGINTGGPCPYLPGNGGLLYAIAMMAAGWSDAPHANAPGFPADGQWDVKWESLRPAL